MESACLFYFLGNQTGDKMTGNEINFFKKKKPVECNVAVRRVNRE